MLLMSPKENQTHIFKVFLIFLKKFSCTTDIFPEGEEEEMGRNLFLCGYNIKSNQQKTKVRDFFCLVAWFGEERWCGGYGCDVLNVNHSRTSTFLVFQDGDGTRGTLTESWLPDGTSVLPGYSRSSRYSFREAGSGRPFTASGRYWRPRLWRTA